MGPNSQGWSIGCPRATWSKAPSRPGIGGQLPGPSGAKLGCRLPAAQPAILNVPGTWPRPSAAASGALGSRTPGLRAVRCLQGLPQQSHVDLRCHRGDSPPSWGSVGSPFRE